MLSEFRQDIISGAWIVVVPNRRGRPHQFKKERERIIVPEKDCPFENPQKSGNPPPLLIFSKPKSNDWFLQVIPNKFPIFEKFGECLTEKKIGPYKMIAGIGAHEVLITRDHNRHFALLEKDELELVFKAYKERYLALSKEYCINYILIIHNHGEKAGASIFHPHSQIFGISIIPPDVNSSLVGSSNYYHKNGQCAHCKVIEYESKNGLRTIFENKNFIVFCPFAPRFNYEIRIFPKFHSPNFEKTTNSQLKELAEAFKEALYRLYKNAGDPDYNFFIHTAPVSSEHIEHYHWHIEILPRISEQAGLEIGTGIEVITIPPEESAKVLRQ